MAHTLFKIVVFLLGFLNTWAEIQDQNVNLNNQDYGYDVNDYEQDCGNGSCEQQNEAPLLIIFIVPFMMIFSVFLCSGCLGRCAAFEFNPTAFFASFKAFKKKGNPLKYGHRLETVNKNKFITIRHPITTSINFELCTKLFNRMKLKGASLSSPECVRELVICFPNQLSKESPVYDENRGRQQTDILGRPTTDLREQSKIFDENKKLVTLSMFNNPKLTTDKPGNEFREYTVSWSNDVLSVMYQGRQIFMVPGLSLFFSTPAGLPFTPVFNPATNPLNNFMITEVSVSSTMLHLEGGVGHDVSLCGLFEFQYGNMATSKWGFEHEKQIDGTQMV